MWIAIAYARVQTGYRINHEVNIDRHTRSTKIINKTQKRPANSGICRETKARKAYLENQRRGGYDGSHRLTTILAESPPVSGTAARYASISSSRSWAVSFFLVKRAGPFLVFFLFVGTALGLVATSEGATEAF